MKNPGNDSWWGGVVKAMGLVFGDIGTSPIYTLTVVFALTEPNRENVLGILSLVFWTLVLLVTVEFCWLAMSLSHKGEGGKIVMKEILVRIRKQGRVVTFVSLIAYLGVGLLLGDGVITPAISILSAVEGAVLIPGLEDLSEPVLILAAAVIAVGLFAFQKGGTDRVAKAFGPVMVVWFAALSASGIASIGQDVEMLGCVSPHHAFQFFQRNGIPGLFVLSEVILCATGGEALYADMGHLGRKPILNAWNFVFVALVLNYIGQGVYAVHHPEAKNLLFAMVKSQVPVLYIPFLILTISATIIASQAMISGVFSVIYQGITTRVFPLMKVDYTSTQLKSQIYVGSVNWMLLASVLFIMLLFKRSTNLAAAYGFAVTGTMVITGVMMLIIFWCQAERWKVPITALVTVIDVVFLIATMNKLPHGGYWSLILAAVPLAVMFIWTRGQKTLYRLLMPLNWEAFHIGYEEVYGLSPRIPGTAVFFTREANPVPPYVVHCILACNIIYERNVFISVARTDEPFGLESDLTEGLASGLDSLTVRAGYLEVPDIEAILREHGIRPKVMFYGVEDIQTRNLFWRVFSTIKKLAPNFVQFYKLPVNRVQGVVTRVEM